METKMPKLLGLSGFLFGIFLTATAQAAPLQVVTSFSILGDLVRQIGGDKVQVETLVTPDADAHVFQPTPAAAKKVAAAQVLVINGLGFEGWMERLEEAADFNGKTIVASSGLKTLAMKEKDEGDEHGHGHEHDHEGGEDPHAWQNVSNAIAYVKNIAAGLATVDTINAAYYEQRAATLAVELAALHDWVKAEIAKVPAAKRRVITSHDAFGYFAKAYGVEFLSPVGYSTDAEPSAADVKNLINQIRKEGIKALFVENMANPRMIKQISEEVGVQPGGKLYADALSVADGPAATYQAMVRHNVATLIKAMQTN
jgi:zinc/manganese transport system substrate-binding protein